MSKMAKDEALLFENPVSVTETNNPVYTSKNQETQVQSTLTENRSPLSVKIEKSSLSF